MEDLRKLTKIETHENVTITYETANAGSRFVAYVIDSLILWGSVIVVVLFVCLVAYAADWFAFAVDVESGAVDTDIFIAAAILLVIIFLIRNFYYIFFEMIWKGSTPGKKAQKLRVVSVTGEPITFGMSLIRNLLRAADSLPGGYLLGGMFVVFSGKSQRLGDFAANTMVVKVKEDRNFSVRLNNLLEEEQNRDKSVEDLIGKYLAAAPSAGQEPVPDRSGEMEGPTISQEEYAVLQEYLQQRDDIPDNRYYDIQLFNYFFRVTQSPVPEKMRYSYVFRFLKEVEEKNRTYYSEKPEHVRPGS